MKVHHPDKFKDKKEQEKHVKISKRINNARDIVKANIKPKQKINSNSNNPDLESLKNRYEIEIFK